MTSQREDGGAVLKDRQLRILEALIWHPEGRWASEVGEALGYSFPANVEAARPDLKALERAGLVLGARRSSGSKRIYYALTTAGAALLAARKTGGAS